MKNLLNTKTMFATVSLTLIFTLSPQVHADDHATNVSPEISESVEQTKQDKTTEKRKEIISEATAAIDETLNALKALDKQDNKQALAALERATGKLKVILARDPELALAPSDVDVVTRDVLTDIDTVNVLRDEAENALDEGRIQDARRILANLVSETTVSTTYIPLVTYPDAMADAAALLEEDKPKQAKEVLVTAMNTLIVADTVIPLPVVTAEKLLQDAEKLAAKTDRSKEEKDKLVDLLDVANAELKFAETLGYGSKKDFKNLYGQLEQIKDKTTSGETSQNFFARIKTFLKDTFESSQPKKSELTS